MNDPRPIGEILDSVLRRFGVARPGESAVLVAEWERVAGEPWASRARPASLTGGVLVVEVDDGATASLLKYRSAELMRRLEGELGQGLVTSVEIKVRRPRRPR